MAVTPTTAITMLEVLVEISTAGSIRKVTKAVGPKPLEAGRIFTMATQMPPEAVAVAVAVAVSAIPAMATGILDVEVSVLV